MPLKGACKINQIGYINMEKRCPHASLTEVKSLVNLGKVRTTQSARMGAVALGFSYADMLAVVLALTPKDFYKSMTSYTTQQQWQDVYRPVTDCGTVYLKLMVQDGVLILSFKER